MSTRWNYKVVELPFKMFSGSATVRMQDELDRMGLQGWELVSVVHTGAGDAIRMVFKKPG